ncbi:MAG: 3-oxoacyl-[acyl-carrier-protein] synthase III C-terminal domain-containing protein [Sedimentisphaerales bacterium]
MSAARNHRRCKIDASRAILRQFGNMSSATILFVLKSILESPVNNGNNSVFAMAFGPGLTVETALLELVVNEKATKAQRREEKIIKNKNGKNKRISALVS